MTEAGEHSNCNYRAAAEKSEGVWVHFPSTPDDGEPRVVAAPCHTCVWVVKPVDGRRVGTRLSRSAP